MSVKYFQGTLEFDFYILQACSLVTPTIPTSAAPVGDLAQLLSSLLEASTGVTLYPQLLKNLILYDWSEWVAFHSLEDCGFPHPHFP